MTPQYQIISYRRAIQQTILAGCLILIWSLAFASPVLAGPPFPAGAETCAECHEDETDAWQESPHANAIDKAAMPGAACEDCHGPYVEDHPKAGAMQLTVDSAICETCHTATFEQWTGSLHAQAGVQCIGCHMSHSQTFRLTDEALCGSCHQAQLDAFSCSVHDVAEVACTECHMSSVNFHEMILAGNRISSSLVPAPGHDFTAVATANCVSCHGQKLHTLSPNKAQQTEANMLAQAERVPLLTSKLETVEQENSMLQVLVPISLGLGIGIGSFLGVIFMLVAGYISRGRGSS